MRMRAVIAALSCVFALVGSPVSAQPLTFITLDSDASNPSGINDSGDIVGTSGQYVYYDCDDTTCCYFEFSGFLDSGSGLTTIAPPIGRPDSARPARPTPSTTPARSSGGFSIRREPMASCSRAGHSPPSTSPGRLHRGAGASVLTATLPAMG